MKTGKIGRMLPPLISTPCSHNFFRRTERKLDNETERNKSRLLFASHCTSPISTMDHAVTRTHAENSQYKTIHPSRVVNFRNLHASG